MSDKKRLQMICSYCGSPEIRRDAYASWNVETQEWELSSTHEEFFCDECGGECNIKEVELDD